MNPIAQEMIRVLACFTGAASFTVLRFLTAPQATQSYRVWMATAVPGVSFGIFLAPLICEAACDQWSFPWLHCGQIHTDCGVAIVTSFFANTIARAMLLSAEKLLPDWLWGSIRRVLGIPDAPPAQPTALFRRPDSDPPLAR